jgi:hypothetical protein
LLEPLLNWISKTSVFGQLMAVTETGYQFAGTPQLVSNSIGGLAFFLLSWWLFGFVSHDPAPEATTRALVPRKTGRLGWFSAGRTWDLAMIWKDFHFIAGGWSGIVMRCGLYVGLYWLAFAAMYPWDQPKNSRTVSWRDVTWGFQCFVVPLFAVDTAMCMSRLFQEEIRHQTLQALLMLPRSVSYVVYTKLAGCLVGLIPGMVAVVTAFFFLTESTKSLFEIIDKPPYWWIAANMFLVIHLSAMLSTYLRWGAFGLSIALTVGSMIGTTMAIQILMFNFGPRGDSVFGFLAIPVLFACAACHIVVLLRLPALGER